jgi:hypothetical protein
MKDMEDLLKKVPLSTPSPSLDQRVEATVGGAELQQAGRRRAMVPLWAFAAGCLACTLIGFLIHPLVNPVPQPSAPGQASVIYIVEPASSELRILGTKPNRKNTPFWQEKRGELIPLVRN